MPTESEGRRFAEAWIAAWNAHDAAAILSHYADDVEYASPFVAALGASDDGRLRGRAALARYVERGLAAYPDLRFELLGVAVGVGSVVVTYRSVGGRVAAELFELDAHGRAERVLCHYDRLA